MGCKQIQKKRQAGEVRGRSKVQSLPYVLWAKLIMTVGLRAGAKMKLGSSLWIVSIGINGGTRDWSRRISSSTIPAQKKRARQSDLPCPRERLRLQRIKEREQLLLLCFGELSEVPGYVLCLFSVSLNGIFQR